jgi:hypothetical protein
LTKIQPRIKGVNLPGIGGQFRRNTHLNTNPNQEPSRFVIDFKDLTEETAREYVDVFNILEEKVKPERWKKKSEENYPYWFHWRPRKELYEKLNGLKFYFLTALTGKNLAFTKSEQQLVISHAAGAILFESFACFPFIQSTFHEQWAWKYCSSMGISLRYTPSDGFQTFPFPQNLSQNHEQKLENIGETYHEHRRQLMLGMQLGLTKTYNAFHSEQITVNNEKWGALLAELDGGKSLQQVDIKAYNFDKESLNLIKHFLKGEPTISLRKAVEGIEQLRSLHVQMDEAVLDAYGWAFDSAQAPAIKLRHNFYEVDYLPENDRIRYTIHPDARKEVLKRLLELNHKIHDEEVKAGLWDKKKGGERKQPVKPAKVSESGDGYGDLFGGVV